MYAKAIMTHHSAMQLRVQNKVALQKTDMAATTFPSYCLHAFLPCFSWRSSPSQAPLNKHEGVVKSARAREKSNICVL